jgi:hypothetical protein
MTLKAIDSTSPLEGGINQQCSVEDLVHALLAPFAQKKEKEADQEFSASTLAFIDWWRSLSERRKREFLRSLIKLTNWWRAEPEQDYGFCFTCAYYRGKGKCRAGCSPRETNKRKQCGTWRVL